VYLTIFKERTNFILELTLNIMDINYNIAGLVLFIVLVSIIYLIVKNQKDKNKFIKNFNKSELKPEKHKDEEAES
jgi:hypothetical protein